ncbi:MAG: hypothetical protein R3F61_33345 [Myxococcota bacterium]
MSEHATHIASAREALEGGDALAASRSLRLAAQTADLHTVPDALVELLGLWAETARYTGYEALGEQCAAAATLEDADVWNAAWSLVDVGLPEVAVPLLRRLDDRNPGTEGVVAELAVALRNSGRAREACEVLERAPEMLGAEPVAVLLAECALQCGDVALARVHAPPRDALLQGVLARHAASGRPLDGSDLRGWHQVLTGGVLLHLSPFGLEAGMNGRYAYSQDDVGRIRMGLARAHAVMKAWGRAPRGVAALPDPASQAVALAAASVWGVPVSTPDRQVPLVGYDLGIDPELLAVAEAARERGALVHVHAVRWTDPPELAPDTLTVLAQIHVAPWDERTQVDPTTGAQTRVPASKAAPTTWAERIASASWEQEEAPGDELAELLAFARAVGPARGPRRSWALGPVSSGRFT